MAIYLEDPRYPGVVGVFRSPGDDVGTYKIGENRGRPRIWIDGKKLGAAGFVGGTEYYCYVIPEEHTDIRHSMGSIVCRLTPAPELPIEGERMHKRKVTGRASGKPIIDMSGADVETAFPGGKRVKVTFSPGKIVIQREE